MWGLAGLISYVVKVYLHYPVVIVIYTFFQNKGTETTREEGDVGSKTTCGRLGGQYSSARFKPDLKAPIHPTARCGRRKSCGEFVANSDHPSS